MIARHQSLPMVNVHARYLESLETEGVINRALEFLPTDKQIAERQSAGSGLRAPEFAVMIAYTKSSDVDDILASDLPEDPALEADLLDYFPSELRERFPDAIRAHRLRREIVATQLVNSMVNLSGISFDHRMTEDTGSTVADVARAFVCARSIVGFADVWHEIDELDGEIDLTAQIDLFLEARRMAERAAGWLLRHRSPPFEIGPVIDAFRPGLAAFATALDTLPSGRVADDIVRLRAKRIDAGIPADLAARSARWPWMHPGFDVVQLAQEEGCTVDAAATAYWSVFEAFDLGWLWDGIGGLPRSDRWQTQARSALRDDLLTVLASLARAVIVSADGSPAAWIGANERSV
jgi:glutamate dehydrogenase